MQKISEETLNWLKDTESAIDKILEGEDYVDITYCGSHNVAELEEMLHYLQEAEKIVHRVIFAEDKVRREEYAKKMSIIHTLMEKANIASKNV